MWFLVDFFNGFRWNWMIRSFINPLMLFSLDFLSGFCWNWMICSYKFIDGVSDLIDAFSDLPRDLNFIQHSSRLGWKL